MNEDVRARLLPATLVMLGVVTALVGSLGAPLLPLIVTTEHVDLVASQWALTISLLTGAVFAPILGRLARGVRRRRLVIITVLAIVALGCVVSALAWGYGMLLFGRALQGIGLGLVPLALATARGSLPPHRLRSVSTLLGVTAVVGIGIAYPVVGFVAGLGGVRAAFFFGAAISVLALLAAAVALPSVPDTEERPKLNLAGALLLAAGVTALLLVTAEGGVWGWTTPTTIGLAVVAVVALVAWVLVELRAVNPLVQLRLLASPPVLSADMSVLLVGIGVYPLLSLVVRFAEASESAHGLGWASGSAGLLLLPYSLASYAASISVSRFGKQLDHVPVIIAGCIVMVVGLGLFALTRSFVVPLVLGILLAGYGTGLVFAVNPLQIHDGVPAAESASANSFYQVLRYVGYSVGSALSATFLQQATTGDVVAPSGFNLAAWSGAAVLVIAAVLAAALGGPTRGGAITTGNHDRR